MIPCYYHKTNTLKDKNYPLVKIMIKLCYTPIMNYETLLREHALKVTPQRLNILALMDKAGHVSIEELYTQVKKICISISLATLYKNINAMLDNGLLSEVKLPQFKSRYEITKHTHAHLVCEVCTELKDIDIDLKALVNKTENRSSYKINDTSLIFSGLCSKCK